jgi:hypothetical protein
VIDPFEAEGTPRRQVHDRQGRRDHVHDPSGRKIARAEKLQPPNSPQGSGARSSMLGTR